MKKHLLPFLCVTLVAVAGCAGDQANTSSEPREEAVYRTGSNIPQRTKPGGADGVGTYGRGDLERARDSGYVPPPPTVPRGG